MKSLSVKICGRFWDTQYKNTLLNQGMKSMSIQNRQITLCKRTTDFKSEFHSFLAGAGLQTCVSLTIHNLPQKCFRLQIQFSFVFSCFIKGYIKTYKDFFVISLMQLITIHKKTHLFCITYHYLSWRIVQPFLYKKKKIRKTCKIFKNVIQQTL